MLTARMLVVLYACAGEDAAVQCALGAVADAASPYGLRFAVPERFRPAFEALEAEALGGGAVKYYDEKLALEAVAPLVTDETHFLFLTGAHAFAEKWDAALYARWRLTRDPGGLMTGVLSAESEGLPAQAYLPGFGDGFGAEGVALCRGLPLVNSRAPVRTLAVDSALLFGATELLRRISPGLGDLSLSAYLAGVAAYALDRAPLWPLQAPPARRLRRPLTSALPGTTLARFEQQAGFRFDQERAGVKTTWGLFYAEDSYPQTLPPTLKRRARLREIRLRFRDRAWDLPLCVTAFKELPFPQKPLPVYMLRFGFLRDVRCLPLVLFTGGTQERYLRAAFPNAWSYPDNGVLPPRYLKEGMTADQLFRRSKLLLLARAAKRQPEYTHLVWLNIDLMKHPVCPDATPDFTPLMDGRVHLATVNAIPDLSCIVVPAERLPLLTRELLNLTQLDVELKRSLTEEALWRRLADRFPEYFTLHPMPKKHLLFLTAFDARLLSAPLARLLRGLPPPVYAETKGSDPHGEKAR